ncbi:MAG TPA: alpha/beta hydrolase [Chloroflexia bacterium]|nr:alpha/beta hydrolase [Chloroflexia bacterium]
MTTIIRSQDNRNNETSVEQKPGGTPTAKALDYEAACRAELALPSTGKQRRSELEEDLGKLKQARFIVLNGVNHFVLDEGPQDGPPVVLVHGWDCSSFWWHSVTRALNAAGYRTLNYDLRGHGFTDDPVEDAYSVEQMAQDLAALVEHFKLEKFHLIAFSVGALVASAYAPMAAQKVVSLAFFNFGLFQYNPRLEKFGPAALGFVFSRVLKKVKAWRPVYAYVRLTLVKNPVSRRDIQYGMLSLKDTSPRAAYQAARSTMSREVLEELPGWIRSLQMPVLLVAGSHDKVISRKSAQNLAALLPNGTYYLMPHCGHLILGELPDQVVTLLKLHMERTALAARSL